MVMQLSFSIAGYIVLISFESTDWPEKRNLLIKMIEKYFRRFIVPVTKQCDAEIIIKEILGIPFIKNGEKLYSRCFEKRRKNIYETYYHISIIELSQLFLIVLIDLLGNNGFLLHASGIIADDGVILFMGESGSGKSSVVKMLSDDYAPFSDDCVVIKQIHKKFVCYQTPWIEKENSVIKNNINYKNITHIYTIKKNGLFAIKPLQKNRLLFELTKNAWVFDTISKYTVFCAGKLVKQGEIGSEITLTLNDRQKLYEEILKKSLEKEDLGAGKGN